MTRVKFTVYGEPKGKGRPRVVNRGGFSKAYTPKDTVNYEILVRMEYEYQCQNYRFPDDAQLDMRIMCYYGIPKSVTKKKRGLMMDGLLRPTKKPDLDNCVKIIADSLNSIAYRDDTQIVDCQCRKFYSDTPRVEVMIQDVGIRE